MEDVEEAKPAGQGSGSAAPPGQLIKRVLLKVLEEEDKHVLQTTLGKWMQEEPPQASVAMEAEPNPDAPIEAEPTPDAPTPDDGGRMMRIEATAKEAAKEAVRALAAAQWRFSPGNRPTGMPPMMPETAETGEASASSGIQAQPILHSAGAKAKPQPSRRVSWRDGDGGGKGGRGGKGRGGKRWFRGGGGRDLRRRRGPAEAAGEASFS